MDFAYIQYLQQIGINPVDYVLIQANYLRFLANSFQTIHRKSNSCSLSNNYSSTHKKNPELNEEVALNSNKVKKIRYDDIPIKPTVAYERLISDELRKNTDKPGKSPEKTIKFEYLKRNSHSLAMSTSKKNLKRENFRQKIIEKEHHKKSQSVNELKNKDKVQFLKKGQGKLCTYSDLLSKSLSSSLSPKKKPSRSPGSNLKFSKSTQKLSPNRNFIRSNLTKLQHAGPYSPDKSKDNQRYLKMLKDVESKSKKFEKDAQEFYLVREKELNSLKTWKNEVKGQVYDEKFSLQNEIIGNKNFETHSKTLENELNDLKIKIDQQEEGFSTVVRELQEKVSLLQKENECLMDKFKSLQDGGLRPPSTISKSRGTSETPIIEARPRSRNTSKDFEVPKLKLEKIGAKIQDLAKQSPRDTKAPLEKTKPCMQRAYFSQKK